MDRFALNFWAFFYLIASAQGLFVSFLLLKTSRGDRKANRYLSALVFLLSVYLFDLFLGRSKLLYQFPGLIYFAAPLWYLFAPLAYFYAQSLLGPAAKMNWKSYLHFMPFLFILAYQVPFYVLPAEIKLDIWVNRVPQPGGILFNYIYALVAPVQISLYTFVILRKIVVHDRLASEKRTLNDAHRGWLKLMFSLLFGYAVVQVGIITHYFLTGTFIPFLVEFRFVVFSMIIYLVAYLAVIEPERIFVRNPTPRKSSSAISTQHYSSQLVELVEGEKLYLNSDLKYTELSQRLNISARLLTEVLNKEIGLSFNDFINTYRVKEVQSRMLRPENSHLSMLALALDSGFSNKSSFNRVFKKHTGLTPSDFLASNNAKIQISAPERA